MAGELEASYLLVGRLLVLVQLLPMRPPPRELGLKLLYMRLTRD